MRSYRYLHLDVFTDQPFTGNQLAVFLDGRGLADSEMQAIAKEMNFSESTFVLPPERPDTDIRLRIFTPGAELPMAGHPTVGTAFALARSGVLAPDREGVVFGLGVGPTPLMLTWHGRDLGFAWMTQRVAETLADGIDGAAAAEAISVPAEAVVSTGLPVQVLSSGNAFLYVPLTTRRAVDAARIDSGAYQRLRSAHAATATGVFLFSTEPAADGATTYSRMFAPDFGVGEDPATGSAAGPLGCYLVRHGIVAPGQAAAMLNVQGVKMGRPSHIHISVTAADGAITGVRVGGRSVIAGEGTIYLE